MTPTQVFQHYLHIVSAESGLPEERILSKSREADVMDVRHILFHLLHIYSLYPAQISREAGVSERRVRDILSGFDNRLRQSRYMRTVLHDVLSACPELNGCK